MNNTTLKNLTLTVLLGTLSANLQAENEWEVNLSAYVGQKDLNNNDWAGTDSQVSAGFLFDVKKDSWPLSVAVDLIRSKDVFDFTSFALRQSSMTQELYVGVRKIFEPTKTSFKPYFGGGVASINGEIKSSSTDSNEKDDNSDVGYWVGVGTYYQFSSNFLLGLDVRYSKANGDIFNIEREMGGIHAGITIGYHW